MSGLNERLKSGLRTALDAGITRAIGIVMPPETALTDAEKGVLDALRRKVILESIGDLVDVAIKTLHIPAGTRRILCKLESNGIQFKGPNIEAKLVCQDTEENILDLRGLRGQWVEVCSTQLEIPETLNTETGGQEVFEFSEVEITKIDPPEISEPVIDPPKKKRGRKPKAQAQGEAATGADAVPPLQFNGAADVMPSEAEPVPEGIDDLTEAQDQALSMLIEGKSVEEIADALNESPVTINRWKKIPMFATALMSLDSKREAAE